MIALSAVRWRLHLPFIALRRLSIAPFICNFISLRAPRGFLVRTLVVHLEGGTRDDVTIQGSSDPRRLPGLRELGSANKLVEP